MAAAVVATQYHHNMLDDYEATRSQIQHEAAQHTEMTPLQDLAAEQTDAYERAQLARRLALALQIAVAAVWGINAIDVAATIPQPNESAVRLEAQPARGRALAVLSMRF